MTGRTFHRLSSGSAHFKSLSSSSIHILIVSDAVGNIHIKIWTLTLHLCVPALTELKQCIRGASCKVQSTSRWLAITYLYMEWLQTTAMHPTNPNCFQVNFLLIIFYKTLWLLQGHLSQEEVCWRGCWGKERKKNDLKYQWLEYIVQNTRP